MPPAGRGPAPDHPHRSPVFARGSGWPDNSGGGESGPVFHLGAVADEQRVALAIVQSLPPGPAVHRTLLVPADGVPIRQAVQASEGQSFQPTQGPVVGRHTRHRTSIAPASPGLRRTVTG